MAVYPVEASAALPDPPQVVMNKMLEAVKSKSYDDFLHHCDDQMRAKLTKIMFEGVSNMMGPRLRLGYKTPYLGKLRQQGAVVYLWKLELADGKDEVLVKMGIRDDKVAGFWLQ
jgi:hypothetical protein